MTKVDKSVKVQFYLVSLIKRFSFKSNLVVRIVWILIWELVSNSNWNRWKKKVWVNFQFLVFKINIVKKIVYFVKIIQSCGFKEVLSTNTVFIFRKIYDFSSNEIIENMKVFQNKNILCNIKYMIFFFFANQ